MLLINKNNNEVLCEQLEIADTFLKRFLGLITKPCPKMGQGLIFFKCNAIHMFFMRYPIDVLFLDMNGCVLKIVDTLMPWGIASCSKASTVIELSPGFCKQKGLMLGLKLNLVESR